jgi:DNA topoisomerase-1
MSDKQEVVKNLKSAVKNCSVIYLASDPDREGEAISQGLYDVLKLKDYHRITFNSITSTAIKQAIDTPRLIDNSMVEAQETRRILDRMLGYKISPVLMKKYGMGSLSAGRVQSVVVRIMVDLENKIKEFKPESEFNGHADTKINNKKISLNLHYKNKLFKGSEEDAKKILKKLVNSKFELVELTEKKREQQPPVPFITSTLQQEASNKLKYDLQKTMKIAQGLYEAGKITYMRTDSPSISKEAIDPIKDVITEKYGEENYKFRTYQSKSASAQEGHECIRPTHPEQDKEEDSVGSSLYSMIWKRTIASLMAPAIHQVFQVTISCSSDPNITFKGSVERLDKPGFLLVYGQEAEEEISLDSSKKSVKLSGIHMIEKISSPPSRYGEASLVKDLEQLEIGRPSTYAALITKIKDRQYIEERDHDGITYDQKTLKLSDQEIIEEEKQVTLGKEKKRLTPTELGLNITKILIDMFPIFLDVGFTAQTEKVLDEIAEGKKKKLPVLTDFWKTLQGYLTKISTLVISKPDSTELGPYKDGKLIIVTTRYGLAIKYEGKNKKDQKYVSITDANIDLPKAILLLENKNKGVANDSGEELGEEGKYKYIKGTSKFGEVIKRISDDKIEYRNIDKYNKDIDLDLAKKLFSYPKDINKKISLCYNLIKDSYYLKEDKTFVSVPKDKIDLSKEELLTLWEVNKDKVKKKFVKT